MTVIGIDTASRVGGVAIVRDEKLLGSVVLGVEEGHSENLLPALKRLMARLKLKRGDVQGIAVAIGPGSFTGLRIGLAAAKALAYAWDVPLRGVGTLYAMAWSFSGVDAVICAALDARRESVFRGLYAGSRLRMGREEAAIAPEGRLEIRDVARELGDALRRDQRILLVGDGAEAIYRSLDRSEMVVHAPLGAEGHRPVNVAHIGALEITRGLVDDPFTLVPNYLRRSEAERRWKAQSNS